MTLTVLILPALVGQELRARAHAIILEMWLPEQLVPFPYFAMFFVAGPTADLIAAVSFKNRNFDYFKF